MKKNLQNWLNEGRLQQHQTSIKEIADLFKVAERDLADAAIKEISADGVSPRPTTQPYSWRL
jgi:hypothetical protein